MEPCTICLEDNTPQQSLLSMCCYRYFHSDCIKSWITKLPPAKQTCPDCRAQASLAHYRPLASFVTPSVELVAPSAPEPPAAFAAEPSAPPSAPELPDVDDATPYPPSIGFVYQPPPERLTFPVSVLVAPSDPNYTEPLYTLPRTTLRPRFFDILRACGRIAAPPYFQSAIAGDIRQHNTKYIILRDKELALLEFLIHKSSMVFRIGRRPPDLMRYPVEGLPFPKYVAVHRNTMHQWMEQYVEFEEKCQRCNVVQEWMR